LDGGGVLIVIAIHQIDLLVSLLGDPLEASARMDTFCASSDAEDTLVGWVRFGSGALASVRCTACDHRNDFSIEIVGEDATLRLIGGGRKIVCRWQLESNNRSRQKRLRALGRKQAPWRLDPGYEAARWMERFYRLVGRTWLPPRGWWHAPFVGQFLRAVHSSTEVPVTPREARRSLELTLALYQSALSGGEVVRIPLTPESPVYSGIDAHVIATLRGG
jgi:predicted dehydrogenase